MLESSEEFRHGLSARNVGDKGQQTQYLHLIGGISDNTSSLPSTHGQDIETETLWIQLDPLTDPLLVAHQLLALRVPDQDGLTGTIQDGLRNPHARTYFVTFLTSVVIMQKNEILRLRICHTLSARSKLLLRLRNAL